MKNILRLLLVCSILPAAAGCQASAQKNSANATPNGPANDWTYEPPVATANNKPKNPQILTPMPEKQSARPLEKGMTLTAIGNGEKVKLGYGRKSATVNLDADYPSDYTPGGDPPHKYTTLLSFKKDGKFYLLAKFRSGPALHSPNGLCGGDNPSTLLLIVADANLKVEQVQTEIFDSCIYNGPGRYPQGKPVLTETRFAIYFEEGAKKYGLIFDAAETEKGLQLIQK